MQNWMLIQDNRVVAGDTSLVGQWKQQQCSFLRLDIEGAAEEADRGLLLERFGRPEAEVVEMRAVGRCGESYT